MNIQFAKGPGIIGTNVFRIIFCCLLLSTAQQAIAIQIFNVTGEITSIDHNGPMELPYSGPISGQLVYTYSPVPNSSSQHGNYAGVLWWNFLSFSGQSYAGSPTNYNYLIIWDENGYTSSRDGVIFNAELMGDIEAFPRAFARLGAFTNYGDDMLFTSNALPPVLPIDSLVYFSEATLTLQNPEVPNSFAHIFFNITSFTEVAVDTGTVPEPAPLALLGIGLAGLALSRRKQ